jgi:hypothetical protein
MNEAHDPGKPAWRVTDPIDFNRPTSDQQLKELRTTLASLRKDIVERLDQSDQILRRLTGEEA